MTKKYNEIEAKDNMNLEQDNNEEEVAPTEKKKLDSVLSTQPNKVNRGLLGRLVTGIVGPEGLPGIGAYVNNEIVKPAIKNIIVDAVTSGINMVMYGEKGGASRGGYRPGGSTGGRTGGGYRPNTNYAGNYRPAPEQGPERVVRTTRQGVEEYCIPERFDAANVLTTLTENADRYDSVSVADYYDLIGAPSQYTDNNHGWTIDTINRAMIVPVRGGYIIKFPPVEVI